MNFYQSQLRKYITKEIYQKPTFEVEILWKKYQWVMKQQKRFGKQMRWYMIHGVELEDYHAYSVELKDAMLRLTRDYKREWWDMFIQIWLVDELAVHETRSLKDEKVREEAGKKRTYRESDLWQRYWLKPSRREHMPNATIILDLKETPTTKSLSTSWKRYVNKWKKAELKFVKLTKKADRETYWEMRYTMAYDKQFSVVPKETFLELMKYLHKEKKWVLFAAKKDDEIVSGALYLFYGKQMVYLYGATDRSFGTIWGQYWLTHEITKRWHKEKYTSLDLLWVSPVWWEKGHDLEWVTRFKQVFGGKTVSYVGNYDLIFNKVAYKGFKFMKWK